MVTDVGRPLLCLSEVLPVSLYLLIVRYYINFRLILGKLRIFNISLWLFPCKYKLTIATLFFSISSESFNSVQNVWITFEYFQYRYSYLAYTITGQSGSLKRNYTLSNLWDRTYLSPCTCVLHVFFPLGPLWRVSSSIT